MFDFFSDFFDDFGAGGFDIIPNVSYSRQNDTACPVCGHTFYDFQQTGKLGCSECYNTFRAPLNSVIRQIHANTVHTGKIPAHCEGRLKAKRRYESLKAKLSEAVKNENYEEAAKIHREMKSIEGEMK